jgi:acyl-CoA-dependent ceramide synthase
MHFETLCDITFGIFIVSWFVARHVLYMTVWYSGYAESPRFLKFGCYSGTAKNLVGPFPQPSSGYKHFIEPFTDPEGTICFTSGVRWTFLSLLLVLQVITLMWFAMILRVAWKVLKGGSAEDSRSDDECEEDETCTEPTEKQVLIELPPLEEEVGVDGLNLKGRASSARRYKKTVSSSSGVTLPGHSDRKELLGRIGCDKGS